MSSTEQHNDREPLRLEDLDEQAQNAVYEACKHGDSDIPALQKRSITELMDLAQGEGIDVVPGLRKQELIFEILKQRLLRTGLGWGEGVLEILPDGFGFLRSVRFDFEPGPDDVYVSPSQIRRLNLKPGAWLAGPVRPPKRGEKYCALLRVEVVNDGTVDDLRRRIPFDEMTPILPRRRLRLGPPGAGADMRMLDLLAPWGFGQRVLVQAPPGCGRTLLLTHIAQTLLQTEPDVHVLVCLVDARPEEVTEVRRNIGPDHRREIVAATFDEPSARAVAVAEMALARAQRMVEAGTQVVLICDSLTQLVRAYNQEIPHSGKVIAAGLDSVALLKPKRLFGAARNLEEGGSLTVIATVLVDTDSRLDEAIAEEFRGKGNCEIVLDRELADQHVYPALDLLRTGTRREDCLLSPQQVEQLRRLRRELSPLPPRERLDRMLALLDRCADNGALLTQL